NGPAVDALLDLALPIGLAALIPMRVGADQFDRSPGPVRRWVETELPKLRQGEGWRSTADRAPATHEPRNRPGEKRRPPSARPHSGKREVSLPSPRSPPWPARLSTLTPAHRADRASPATGSMGRSREASRSPGERQSCGRTYRQVGARLLSLPM